MLPLGGMCLSIVIEDQSSHFNSFGGLLVTSFGYAPKRALELTMPASGVAVFSMIFSG